MKKIRKIAASLMAIGITAAGMGSINASAAPTDVINWGSGVKANVGIQTNRRGKSYTSYVRGTDALVMHKRAKNINCTTNIQYNELWFPDQYSKWSDINFLVYTNPADPSQKIKNIYTTNGASLGDKPNATSWRSLWLNNQC